MKKSFTPPSQAPRLQPYFPSPDATPCGNATATRKGRQKPPQKGIDGNKKAAMMGGSVHRKAFGFGLNRRQDLG
ncbi:hypothetical protein, partial [Xanthomonas sp. 1678]|uniref:hypothetical protein n=1 Tax=Xanthomonas sp. 1678 TaxID=3158788 RepID=UPI00286B3B9F